MRLITKIALLFYTVVIVLLVAFAMGLAFKLIPVNYVSLIANIIYEDQQLRMILALTAVLVFSFNILFNQAIAGKEFREKNIAFDNPSGRVSVSLTAMEDLIRRVVGRMNGVKDVRSVHIIASKRGLDVKLNLALFSDVSIPEATGQMQETVKRQISDTIGLEETVTVRVDVTKISGDEGHNRAREKDVRSKVDALEPTVPFQGYRA